MIEELQKRPFSRPLIIWCIGICIEMYCGLNGLFILALSIALIYFVLTFSNIFLSKKEISSYDSRANWGIMFSILLLTCAILKTNYNSSYAFSSSFVSEIMETSHALRNHLLEKFDFLDLNDTERGVLSTLTLGDKSSLDYGIRQQFTSIGIAHLFAVSGFHVGIVASFVGLLLVRLPRFGWGGFIRWLILFGVIWIFTFVTGFSPSALRATIMCSLFFTANLLNRQSDGYNILFVSAFLMLVINPYMIIDVGFQLSYVAVFFIFFITPRISKLIKVYHPLISIPWNCLTISLAVQLGTMGFCFYYFGQCSLIFLFTAIPFALIAMIIIPCTLIWLLIPINWTGGEILGNMICSILKFMLWMVESFSQLPYARIQLKFDDITLLLYYIVVVIFLLFLKFRKTKDYYKYLKPHEKYGKVI